MKRIIMTITFLFLGGIFLYNPIDKLISDRAYAVNDKKANHIMVNSINKNEESIEPDVFIEETETGEYIPFSIGAFENDKDSQIYKQISNGIATMENEIFITTTEGSTEHILEIIRQATECPEFFWVKKASWVTWTPDNTDESVYNYTITIEYNMNKSERNKILSEVNKAADAITSKTSQVKTAKSFSADISIWFRDNSEYQYNKAIMLDYPYNQATGPLLLKEGICSGLSKAYAYLMLMAGYDVAYVVGNSNEQLHAWNIIKKENEYLYTDITYVLGTSFLNSSRSINVTEEKWEGYNAETVFWYTPIQ